MAGVAAAVELGPAGLVLASGVGGWRSLLLSAGSRIALSLVPLLLPPFRVEPFAGLGIELG